MTKRNGIWVFGVLIALVLVGGGWVWLAAADETAESANAKETVTVNLAINSGLSTFNILKEQGKLDNLLDKVNAKAVWSEVAGGPAVLEALTAKRADLSFLGDGAALQGQAAGLPFVNIGLLSEGSRLNSVLAKPDSGIPDIGSLKGKKIGVPKGTTSHVYLAKLLAQYGLKESDVSIINLQFAEAAAAFQSGQVDAISTIDPYKTQLLGQKQAVALSPKEEVKAPITLVARSGFAKEHPEIVKAVLEGLGATVEWQKANPGEAAELFAGLKNLDTGLIKAIDANLELTFSPITEEIAAAQQQSADFLYETQLIKKPVVYTDYVDNQFIESVLKGE
ncbi:aliphatic sulfonate ABC transporter substrate-binding protein [Paenibacillus typhae]|uniref:aliphatic sulfonate ABC transporter substrate-binding protein n=1 Tax=Paenibacillus typhae TaxID=1174501 RepID=UPI001C8EEE7D|nr:aliphatic sulfonate ABC transporter substrate-binding protein [Paenibacillus typhae]MBY0011694.1 aliphatic sulfonate ABC transporter substrate-binding protein [Paenibacillus typhae]